MDFETGFSIEGPSQAKIECHDNGDGSADVRYYPVAPGEYAVHILCDNEDIPKSPYMANILPKSNYYPDKVIDSDQTDTFVYLSFFHTGERREKTITRGATEIFLTLALSRQVYQAYCFIVT